MKNLKKTFCTLTLTLAFILLFTNIPFNLSAKANEATLIFELTDSEVDSFITSNENHTFLRPSGNPPFSKSTLGGISITDRNQDWQALDIRCEWMEPGKTYHIIVEFASDEPTHFKITNTDAPYGVSLAATSRETTSAVLEYEMTHLNTEENDQRGVRLTTHPQSSVVDYTIVSIKIYEGDDGLEIVQRSWQTDLPSLYQTFSNYFPIGNILEHSQLENEELIAMYLTQYNVVTAENSMKPDAIARTKGSFNFENAEKIVDWAEKNGVEMHGHTLVWHSQSADWLTKDSDGNPLTRNEARTNMKDFIDGYAGHFVGRVASWDVVNEAFTDSVSPSIASWKDGLRKDSPWYLAYANGMNEATGEAPEDYIYDAFVFTRLIAPDAMLFYNDFNEETEGKRNAIAAMVEEFNERWQSDSRNDDTNRLLIEVVGMQAHYWTSGLDPEDVRASIQRFAATGAKVAITELDIPMGGYGAYTKNYEDMLPRQAQLYEELFKIFMDNAENIVRVSVWGKADHQSWRSQGYPTMFDTDMQAKPAFWQVIQLVDPSAQPSEVQPELPIDSEPADPNSDTEPNGDPTTPDTPAPTTEAPKFEVPIWVIISALAIPLAGVVIIIIAKKKSS